MYSFFHQCLFCYFASIIFKMSASHFGSFQELVSGSLRVLLLSQRTILTLLARMPPVSPQTIHSAALKVYSLFSGVFSRCLAWRFAFRGPQSAGVNHCCPLVFTGVQLKLILSSSPCWGPRSNSQEAASRRGEGK